MKLLWQDWIIIFGILLHIGCIISTNFVYVTISSHTEFAEHLEMNPIARQTLDIKGWFTRFGIAGVGMILGIYLTIRTLYMRKKSHSYLLNLNMSTMAFFFANLVTFWNDFSVALKYFMEMIG